MDNEDEETLKELNKLVKLAINNRMKWLDANMAKYANIGIGEKIYNLKNGSVLGEVTRQYRIDDSEMTIYYEYRMEGHPNSYSNTSCNQIKVGTKEQYIQRLKHKQEMLAWEIENYG